MFSMISSHSCNRKRKYFQTIIDNCTLKAKAKKHNILVLALAFKIKHKKVKNLVVLDIMNQELIDFVFQVTRETVLRSDCPWRHLSSGRLRHGDMGLSGVTHYHDWFYIHTSTLNTKPQQCLTNNFKDNLSMLSLCWSVKNAGEGDATNCTWQYFFYVGVYCGTVFVWLWSPYSPQRWPLVQVCREITPFIQLTMFYENILLSQSYPW